MKNKYSNLTKNTILFAISSFGSKFVSFILLPLYTYVLSTSDYGTADIMVTAVSLLLPILTINIQDAVLRFALNPRYRREDVFTISIQVTCAGAAILGVILAILGSSGILKFEIQYIVFVWASFICHSLYNIFSMYLKAINKVKVFAISGIINTLSIAILNILLLVYVRIGVTGYLIASVVGIFIAVVTMFLWGKLYREIDFKSAKKVLFVSMAKYSVPLIANSLAWWLNTASDRYILLFYCGAAVNGIYAVSYKVPTILSTIQHIFYNAWSVSAITEFDSEDKDGFISKTYILYMALSIVGCSAIIIMNIPIAKILYSKDFYEAWRYVPILLVGTVFNGLALFEGCLFTAVNKTRIISRTTMIGAAINTCLNFGLIPLFGATGAAIATLIGYFSIWFIRGIALKRIINMKICWWRIGISIIALFIQMGAASISGAYWIQILPLIIILILLREQFSKIVSGILSKIRNIRK